MPVLPRRFERLKSILDCRMADLTVLLENVDKPHNLSAILRTCDAVGVLEANAIQKEDKTRTFNSTAQGSQKWVKLNDHKNINEAIRNLKQKGFYIYGTNLSKTSKDFRHCDFTKPTAFVIGTEKWGLSDIAISMVDESIFIPMRGMVQSLNVSVATAILLFEALSQRQRKGIIPISGEGLDPNLYKERLFEWTYPEIAQWCNQKGKSYPEIDEKGEILEDLPRNIKLKY